ncbi:MAG: 50S ribosomal protein L3 [Candidatus Woesebacteria bacterium]|jgi:large subunit ribosomal protein L3
MLNTIFATKVGMTQAWSSSGKRLAVTKLKVGTNAVVGQKNAWAVNKPVDSFKKQEALICEIAYGKKKLKNLSKPLKEKIKKSGFSEGFRQIRGLKFFPREAQESELKVGDAIKLDQVLEPGDVVKVQGRSKGRGFAGVIKRHGFAGGPRTHGQSDRERAPGSIGSGTDPGRVWKGKKMPGHYGAKNKTVSNLVVLYIDPEKQELWLSGPVPGHNNSIVRVEKLGFKKKLELNLAASGLGSAKEAKQKTPSSAKNEKSKSAAKSGKKDQKNTKETK